MMRPSIKRFSRIILYAVLLQASTLTSLVMAEGETTSSITPTATQPGPTGSSVTPLPTPTSTPIPQESCVRADIDAHLRCLINRNHLTGDPSTGRNLPNIKSSPMAQLGRKLFFSKDLGGNNDAACVTCHHPFLGGGDALSLSIGAESQTPELLGPGRRLSLGSSFNIMDSLDPGPTEPRNAPTTFNVGMLDSGLFWDNRIESLGKTPLKNGADGFGIKTPDELADEDGNVNGANLPSLQSQFPVTSPVEMKGKDFEDIDDHGGFNTSSRNAARSSIVARMKSSSTPSNSNRAMISWVSLFEDVGLPADFTFEHIGDAIAEYERSQVFISNPWKDYVKNQNLSALTRDAKLGAILFLTPLDEEVASGQMGRGCVACHSGDTFTDEKFHVVAIPQIGRGGGRDRRSNEPESASTGEFNDLGRYFVSGEEDDRFAFRTPTLLNVEVTGPYGHSGAYTSLEAVIKHYGDPKKAIETYDFRQLLDIPEEQTRRMKENTMAHLQLLSNKLLPVDDPKEFKDHEVRQMVAFMKALTDPCTKQQECLKDWVPASDEEFPGKLNAHDQWGDPLFSQHLATFNATSAAGRVSSSGLLLPLFTAVIIYLML